MFDDSTGDMERPLAFFTNGKFPKFHYQTAKPSNDVNVVCKFENINLTSQAYDVYKGGRAILMANNRLRVYDATGTMGTYIDL